MIRKARFCSAGFGLFAAITFALDGCSDETPSSVENGSELAPTSQALCGDRGTEWCRGKTRRKPLPPHVRRNVILVIGDGRQFEDEVAISRYLYGRDFGLSWDTFPYQAWVATWDVTSYNEYAAARNAAPYDVSSYDPLVGYDPALAGSRPFPLENPDTLLSYLKTVRRSNGWWAATDSASAATAMATGIKTDDGNVAWLPGDLQGGTVPSVGEQVRAARGMSFGIVSTQPLSAATPAAFAAHNVSRVNAKTIANEILFTTEPEVCIAGGHPSLKSGSIAPTDLDRVKAEGIYTVVERVVGQSGSDAILAGAQTAIERGTKLFGLFGGSTGSFELGVPADAPGNPNVSYTLENPSLADATEAALDVLRQNPAGFFLMVEAGDIDTANHVNDYAGMIACGADMERAVIRILEYVDRPDDDITWANTTLLVVADHATGYLRLNPDIILGRGDLPTQVGNSYPDGEVGYGTKGHTNELVRLSVKGHMAGSMSACEGDEYPGTRILNNTVIHSYLLRAAGL